MTSIDTGNRAEQAATEYLSRLSYEIVERNFRRSSCEIDIVAQKNGVLYFVEVKYRATDLFGSGFDYINANKLRHMQRAAQVWVSERSYRGEYALSAIEVSGPYFDEIEYIESLDL